MPKSKNADVRIKVIDRCLSDKNRKYSTTEMMDLCNKELEKMDFPLISAPNSIRNDIAQIERMYKPHAYVKSYREGRNIYYHYEDPDFSIFSPALSSDEVAQLTQMLGVLKRFKGKVSLFIGSGFSLEANAPSARMLCEAILSQIDDEQLREVHKDDSLADVSNFFVENVCNGSRNSLIEILQKQFEFKPGKMDDHQTLAKIPHFHNIFTTNYDTLLEDSYSKEDCLVIRKDADCAYLDNNKPVKVFKIHGDFINPDYVVITSKDYEDFFNNRVNTQMWDVVKHDFLTKNILFIGYSLEDDNIPLVSLKKC